MLFLVRNELYATCKNRFYAEFAFSRKMGKLFLVLISGSQCGRYRPTGDGEKI